MIKILFSIALFVAGIPFTVYGLRVLFEKGYIEKRFKTETWNDQYFNVVYMGLRPLAIGLTCIIVALLMALQHIFLK